MAKSRDGEHDDPVDLDASDDVQTPSKRNAARKATMYALPAALLAGLLTFWLISKNLEGVGDDAPENGPLKSVSITEVEGTSEQCANLIDGLPDEIDGRNQRAVIGHPGSLAWGDPPVVLVCGVAKPESLTAGSPLNAVNSVTWLVEEDVDTTAYGLPGNNYLWTAVDREVYIAVAIPSSMSGSVAIAPISKAIDQRLLSIEE